MIRKSNLYKKPKKSFEAQRIKEENVLVKKYGLKNKKEIWKASAKIDYFRKRAMALAKSSFEEQEVLFNKLRNLGLEVNSTSDVLDLKVENLLERRLPTLVMKKNLAQTVRQARQMVSHKRVMIGKQVINIPSYIVSVEEENSISLKKKAKSKKAKDTPEQEAQQQ